MDFTEQFLEYTANIPSPKIFRLWAAISALGIALERRVWLETSAGKLYPNLYTMLVAPPAVGKGQAIDTAIDLLRATKKFHIAPDSMTKASLLDRLNQARTSKILNGGKGLFEYHSLAIGVEEFGTLVPAHDMEFLSFLIRLYNNPPSLSEDRRTSTSVDIVNPQLNLLVGTQPGFLAHLLPEEAWAMGFMSRMVMVYATFAPDWDIFGARSQDPAMRQALVSTLAQCADHLGAFTIGDDYKDALRTWRAAGFTPVPEHSRLTHYNARRMALAIKLSMISAVSRGNGLAVDASDLARAKQWMLEVEVLMPDIFREMAHKSDAELIGELCFYISKIISRHNKPVGEAVLYDFLHRKAPAERIPKIIEIAEKANILERFAGSPPSYKTTGRDPRVILGEG